MLPFSRLLSYTVAALCFGVGVLLIAGLYVQPSLPGHLRITMGVVMLLLGVYRAVVTATRDRGQNHG